MPSRFARVSRNQLLRGVYAYGFERPSAIQQRAIVPIVKGHDVIAQAQSGTGKTATFSISILQSIDPNLRQCQALVLAPTRELAQQSQKVLMALGDYLKIECYGAVGGTSVRDGMTKLQEGVHVVVGTPGRVFDVRSGHDRCGGLTASDDPAEGVEDGPHQDLLS